MKSISNGDIFMDLSITYHTISNVCTGSVSSGFCLRILSGFLGCQWERTIQSVKSKALVVYLHPSIALMMYE